MENIIINVAELLKDCPKGMELYSPVWNNIVFEEIEGDNIVIFRKSIGSKIYLTQYGAVNRIDGKCVIFPKGKNSWEGFQRPFKDGDILTIENYFPFIYKTCDSSGIVESYCGINTKGVFYKTSDRWTTLDEVTFATEEEKERLFQAIKDNGYKWNSDTKTLEELFKPKFKVGDKIRLKNNRHITDVITDITENQYVLSSCGLKYLNFKYQDKFELVPNKFDFSTLIGFESKVLVRNSDTDYWLPDVYVGRNNSNEFVVLYKLNPFYIKCIPYEGNEHLLGTTNDCDDFYKN